MKYIGIDYGEKNVGIAVSDDEGKLAFAKTVLKNDKNLLENVAKICRDEKIFAIVLGESLDFDGKPNPIMKDILIFKKKLVKTFLQSKNAHPNISREEKCFRGKIYLEPEFLTSAEAEHLQDKTNKLDASAAALILKSYLDKQNWNQKKNETI